MATVYEFPTGRVLHHDKVKGLDGVPAGKVMSAEEVIQTYPVYRHVSGIVFASIVCIQTPDGSFYGAAIKEYIMNGHSVSDTFHSVFEGFFVGPGGDPLPIDFVISSILHDYEDLQCTVIIHPMDLMRMNLPGPGWEMLDTHDKEWKPYNCFKGE